MKTLLILLTLMLSLNTSLVYACDIDPASIDKLEANTVVFKPIVKINSIEDKVVNKKYYFLVKESPDNIGCGENRIYLSKIWLGIILLILLTLISKKIFPRKKS